MKDDLMLIKKLYGEHIARLCREIVPELFEEPNLVPRLLAACFAPHAELYQDMLSLGKYNVRNYMYSRLNRKEEIFTTPKSTKELLADVGYRLFVCTRPEDINYFKSCYDPEELLCTFRDGVENRFKDAYYFFLAKENAFSLKRSDFTNPRRDDEYSTSLICLQIDRVNHNIKMCSRYNHTVDYADSMFSNNLDNIVPGLRFAMERDFNIKISHRECVDLTEMMAMNYVEYGPFNTMFKFNEQLNGKFYCPNNIVLENNEIHVVEKDHSALLDYIVIDNKEKVIKAYDSERDDYFSTPQKFKKCDYLGGKDIDTYKITFEDDRELYLMADKMNRIKVVTDNDSTEIGDNYFGSCHYIEEVNTKNARRIGDDFVSASVMLKSIYSPYVEEIGDNFAAYSRDVRYINFDYLMSCGSSFFMSNVAATEVVLPELLHMGDFGFMQNTNIRKVVLPKDRYLGSECFGWCTNIEEIYAPNVRETGGECFYSDFNASEYIENTVMNNFDRGDDYEMDMAEVQSVGRSR